MNVDFYRPFALDAIQTDAYKMSGHNPHSRVSQPINSSSWNYLQVPYARQPQLAHMSSDRTLRSSPLIWPNTNPADAFYNYMALTAAAVANSNPKNSLDINPLLPFVRTPANAMPFNSVDLSLSSSSSSAVAHANRNSLTPSPRTQISPVSGASNNRFAKTQNDNEDSNSNANANGANKTDNNKLNTDPIAFLHEMSEQLSSMRSNRNLTASANFARDSNNLNSDLSNFRNNGGNEKLQQRTEPMELVKEHPNPANLFENESLSQSVHLQQLLGLAVQSQPSLPLPSSTTSSITPNLNDLSKMLSIINNTSPTSPTVLISPKSSSTPSSSNFVARQCAETQSKQNCLNTSNDDSLDSQSTSCNGGGGGGGNSNGGAVDDASPKTRYRRRKPQKTIRLSNEPNATDSVTEPLENDATRANATKHEHSKHDTNHSNGLNFPTFHSDANSVLTPSNSAGIRPTQTQSMDLSHHCGKSELFENGLVNYSKSNTSLDLTHTNVGDGHCSTTKELITNTGNLMPADEMNRLNLFGGVNFGHLRGTNLTNEIATFPNTDDLVKKVEELVKCNEQNGFVNNDFGPMELIKSHANKVVSDAYENTRLSNGLLDSMMLASNIKNLNNHVGAAKHNGNRLLTEMISNSIVTMENKLHEIEVNRDSGTDTSTEKMLSNGIQSGIPNTNPNPNPNPNRNGVIETINSDKKQPNSSHGMDSSAMTSEFTDIGPVTDMMYEKMSEEITNNQSNMNTLNKNFAAKTSQENNSSSCNSNNELTKEALSASSSDASPSMPSSSIAKKKTSNPTKRNNASNRSSTNKMSKPHVGSKNSNQKNAKSKDKSDKKSDINEKKKTKSSIDESAMALVSLSTMPMTTAAAAAAAASAAATETLNKFRGPYVHVSRDGTHEVINAPLNEEVSEKQSKLKKNYISQRPVDRNKVRGLHVSTLSRQYDVTTRDISWMCVFCKLGPHKYGLGDLFGPFILTTEGEDFQLAQLDPKDDIFGRHQSRASSMAYSQNLTAAGTKPMAKSTATGNVAVKKKRKFNQTDTEMCASSSNIQVGITNSDQTAEIDIFYGMTRAGDNSYEVWAHEDCIVWASGVHIIGARVVGLEMAVWGSVRHQCSVCKQNGAMLSCLQRTCSDEVHVPCAKRCNWNLNEHIFQSRCSAHGDNDVQNSNTNDKNN